MEICPSSSIKYLSNVFPNVCSMMRIIISLPYLLLFYKSPSFDL